MTSKRLHASFRDPAGYVYRSDDGGVARAVTNIGKPNYDLLMRSGLYEALVTEGLLIPHVEVQKDNDDTVVHLKPEHIQYITYPYEWPMGLLQDAALITLRIQKIALQHGMSLKDASAYNVQFYKGKPIFIDTLSFEAYEEGKPWQAYDQFCRHFIAPLALMSKTDIRLQQLLQIYIDGIPLDLASKLLPMRIKAQPGIALHIAMHSRMQTKMATKNTPRQYKVTKNSIIGIIDSLRRTIQSIKPPSIKTEWGAYYSATNYSESAIQHKADLVKKFAIQNDWKSVLDLGGNNGRFSRLLHDANITTVCADVDPMAVQENYRLTKQNKESLMVPICLDLHNPAGALGWSNVERTTLHERVAVDAVLALALVHHLAISNNVPFRMIAEYFAQFGPYLLVEFIPKTDSMVQRLLATRKDIFPDYNETAFIEACESIYSLIDKVPIEGSERTLLLFRRIE